MNTLDRDTLRLAADSLAKRPRADVWAASRVVGEVLLAQAEARTGAVSHQQIEARCGEVGATDATAEVDGVKPIEVLRRGPRSSFERAVVSVLLARHVGALLDGDGGSARVRARLADLDWLEFTGPYAPYEAARVGLSADTAARFDALLAETDIEGASSRAVEAVRALRGLRREGAGASSEGSMSTGRPDANVSIAVELEGHARGFARRLLGAIVGWGALRAMIRTVGGWVFSFKRPATLSLEGETLRLVGHSEVLGRTLRTWDVRLPVRELIELRKEVRYPSAPAALSIAGLLVGTLLGARRVFEGVGARWFAVVAIGLGTILLGVALELVLRALWPGLAGKTRLYIRSRDARTLELTHVDSAEAERLLDAVDALLAAPRSGVPTVVRDRAPRSERAPRTTSDGRSSAEKSWDVSIEDRTVEDPVKLDEASSAPTLLAGSEATTNKRGASQ